MENELESIVDQNVYIHQTTNTERNLNPGIISVPPGYQIEVFAQGLDTPIGMVFIDNGDMLIGDAGSASGNPKVLRLSNGNFEVVADGFNVPLTGINYRNGDIYVSHKGVISIISPNGTRQDIIRGLPSGGDFSNNQIAFSQDGKMYFGQGTATNSGVVGLDNAWILDNPFFHDYPGTNITLNGFNFETSNILVPAEESAYTGAFSPFGIPSIQNYEVVKGIIKASGSIMRANLDGSDIELVAWGFRNPFGLKFDQNNRLIISNQGLDNRGSRPIANGSDALQLLIPGAWFGWPDYASGEPITIPRFRPEGRQQPELLFSTIPSVPPRPIATFPPGSTIMGFDINYDPNFGTVGDLYIAKFGRVYYEPAQVDIRSGVGHRVTRVNMINGEISTFAINKSGFPQEGGLGRPTDVVFGPDGAMYISDFSTADQEVSNVYLAGTGAIWRIIKT